VLSPLVFSANLVFVFDLLIVLAFFFVSSLLLDSRPTRFGGAVTKLRRYDEL